MRTIGYLVSKCYYNDPRVTFQLFFYFFSNALELLVLAMEPVRLPGLRIGVFAYCEDENTARGDRYGWGAGIRTPIIRSRAACPAIGRLPNNNQRLQI